MSDNHLEPTFGSSAPGNDVATHAGLGRARMIGDHDLAMAQRFFAGDGLERVSDVEPLTPVSVHATTSAVA
jgi:hypothetical protein